MIELKTYPIQGLVSFENKVFRDERGFFLETHNQKKFNDLVGNDINFVQDNLSSSKKNVLRGLHFQKPPFAQAKLVRVIKGSVLDVAVDLRKKSPTYGQYQSIILSENNFVNFFVPRGFAHGFLALEENTIFAYKCDNFYDTASEEAILWNDITLKIDWGIDHPIVSFKDKEAQVFLNFKSPFE